MSKDDLLHECVFTPKIVPMGNGTVYWDGETWKCECGVVKKERRLCDKP